MIPAVLLPFFVSFAYDTGRCVRWMQETNRVGIEQSLERMKTPAIWESYLRGRENDTTDVETCNQLADYHQAEFWRLNRIIDSEAKR